jgi:hypothetical protein
VSSELKTANFFTFKRGNLRDSSYFWTVYAIDPGVFWLTERLLKSTLQKTKTGVETHQLVRCGPFRFRQ